MSTNIIPSDQQSIYASLSLMQKKALAMPNGGAPSGIAGYLFDGAKTQTLDLTSSITDYPVENNTTIQDNIALMPERVTLTGLIAEIVDVSSYPAVTTTTSENSLPPTTTISTPGASTTDSSVVDIAPVNPSYFQLYFDQTGGTPDSGQQQVSAIGFLYQLWLGQSLFTVETPWGIFTNMAIESINATQPEETEDVTEVSVTFKRIRFANAITVQTPRISTRLDAQQQAAAPVNLGLVALKVIAADTRGALLNLFGK